MNVGCVAAEKINRIERFRRKKITFKQNATFFTRKYENKTRVRLFFWSFIIFKNLITKSVGRVFQITLSIISDLYCLITKTNCD